MYCSAKPVFGVNLKNFSNRLQKALKDISKRINIQSLSSRFQVIFFLIKKKKNDDKRSRSNAPHCFHSLFD